MLDLWWTELRQVKAHLRALFPHPSVAASAAAFLDGLLGPERRKTGWMRAASSTRPAFSSRARARVGLDGQTPDRRARSPTVRSACWRLMSRTRAAPSSTARLI